MKIEHKVYVVNIVHFGLIVLIWFLGLQNLNQILTKFRFIEIADDLNASFLEMRLAEKNYFLYEVHGSLADIIDKIDRTDKTLDQMEADVIRAVGRQSFDQLHQYLAEYGRLVDGLSKGKCDDPLLRQNIREAGQRLKNFSESTTGLERKQVGAIIARSKSILLLSFWSVVLFAAFFSYVLVRRNIGLPLRRIVALTQAISKGNYVAGEAELKAPRKDEIGAVIGAINAMASELHKREQEIIQSKRLASIGVLVAGVAHELNNPLNNISMIAQTYAEVYESLSKEQRIDFMNRVEEETGRLQVIIKNLLDFSKPKERNLIESEANTVVEKSLGLVQNMLDISNIRVALDLARDLPKVYIDEQQIPQVLVNIFINAIQAMAPGGELRIASRYLPDPNDVEIEIGDNGKGIAPEFLDHIFDPFFTTKEQSGTGLGLWVSYGIIKNHGGNIRVESTVGLGTTFFITLPTCQKIKRCSHAEEAQRNDH